MLEKLARAKERLAQEKERRIEIENENNALKIELIYMTEKKIVLEKELRKSLENVSLLFFVCIFFCSFLILIYYSYLKYEEIHK